ncbi:MAG: 3'-5' exonuclease, partial [Rhodoferax sp.]
GEPVRVLESPSDVAEAQWMVEEIKQLVRDDLPRSEVAVLYRSNAQSRVIETALFNAGMPYKVYGGLRFFERAEIKHALAYLRLLENPNDDTSFMRVVNFPPRGIGARSLEQLQDVAREQGGSLHAAVAALKGKAGANIGAFVAKLDVLREQTQNLSLREIIELVLEHSGLVEHYRADREGEDRVENLEELVNAAESFVTQEGFGRDAVALPVDELQGAWRTETDASASAPAGQAGPPLPSGEGMGWGGNIASGSPDLQSGETLSPLASFLSHAALESGDNQAQAGQDAVQLMTVHASKGLEFDCVFIGGLEKGLFPHENSMSSHDGLEEERRLMYVAITRARKRLYLSHSQTRMLHGQTRYNVRSRFFDELPEAAVKWLSPRQGAFAPGRAGGYGNHGGFENAIKKEANYAYSTRANSRFDEIKQSESAAGSLRTGQKVFHNKFGEGLVLMLEGSGADARAQINFPRHGVKWLALAVAKLTPLP